MTERPWVCGHHASAALWRRTVERSKADVIGEVTVQQRTEGEPVVPRTAPVLNAHPIIRGSLALAPAEQGTRIERHSSPWLTEGRRRRREEFKEKSQSTRNLKLFFTSRGSPSKLKNQITRDDISTFFPSQFTRGVGAPSKLKKTEGTTFTFLSVAVYSGPAGVN